jgi:hypothetical protein
MGAQGPIGPIGPKGATGATGPTGAAGTTGQDVITVYSTGGVVIGPATPFTLVPGLTTTVNVPANTKVSISSYGAVQTTSGSFSGFSIVDVVLMVDGVILPSGAYHRVIAANTPGLISMFQYWAFTTAPVISAGSHTFTVMAAGTGGSSVNATVAGDTNSVLQGELTLVFVKQ